METNIEPLLALYPEVDRVLVLRGLGDSSDEAAEREALRPSRWARKILKSRGIETIEIDVRPQDVLDCRKALTEALLQSGQKPSRVLLNVTGGTKAMAIGALSAAMAVAPERTQAFLYSTMPWPRVDIFTGGVSQALSTPVLSLEELLDLRGFRLLNDRDSRQAEEKALLRRSLTDWLYQFATAQQSHAWAVCSVLNNLAQAGGLSERGVTFPRAIAEPRVKEILDRDNSYSQSADERWDFWHRLIEFSGLNVVLDLSDETQAIIPNEDALRYLGGGWLEEAVWLIAGDALHKTAGAQVRLGLRLGLSTHQTGRRTDEVRECDVLILVGGRIHVIECKTGEFQKDHGGHGINQDTINKLSDIHSTLTGRFSTVAIINPRQPPQTNAHAMTLLKRAQVQGFKTWLGDNLDLSLHDFLNTLEKSGVLSSCNNH